MSEVICRFSLRAINLHFYLICSVKTRRPPDEIKVKLCKIYRLKAESTAKSAAANYIALIH